RGDPGLGGRGPARRREVDRICCIDRTRTDAVLVDTEIQSQQDRLWSFVSFGVKRRPGNSLGRPSSVKLASGRPLENPADGAEPFDFEAPSGGSFPRRVDVLDAAPGHAPVGGAAVRGGEAQDAYGDIPESPRPIEADVAEMEVRLAAGPGVADAAEEVA